MDLLFSSLLLALVGAGFGGIYWRILVIRRRVLSDVDADGYGRLFLDGLFWRSPGPDELVEVNRREWTGNGATAREAFDVARQMRRRGLIACPTWGLFQMLTYQLPTAVALTRKAWEQLSPSPSTSTVMVYGPAVVGGTQINSGTFSWAGEPSAVALTELVIELATDIRRAEGEQRQHLEKIARTLSDAVDTGRRGSPEVRASLRWLAEFANATSANVVSATIVAAATALLEAWASGL